MNQTELTDMTSEQVRAALPYGGLNKVIELSGLGRTTVNAVINDISDYSGPADSYEKVVNAIITVLNENKQKKEDSYSQLSKALQGCKI